MTQYDEPEQQLEIDGRDDKEIDCGDTVRVVPEKGLPRLRGRATLLHNVFGDR